MAAGYLHALKAVLLIPLEHLGEVPCPEISRSPIPNLGRDLLRKVDTSQLSLYFRSTHQQ
jgi:hypothetical protein